MTTNSKTWFASWSFLGVMVMLTINLNASYGGVAENVSTMSIGLRRLVSCTHKRHRTFGRISSPLLMST